MANLAATQIAKRDLPQSKDWTLYDFTSVLLPAFAGVFAMPWVLENILSRAEIPKQHNAPCCRGTTSSCAVLWFSIVTISACGAISFESTESLISVFMLYFFP